MDLCPSIDFFGVRVMCMPSRCYEVLGRVMWVIKGLWPLNGQVDYDNKTWWLSSGVLSEHQTWRHFAKLSETLHITAKLIQTTKGGLNYSWWNKDVKDICVKVLTGKKWQWLSYYGRVLTGCDCVWRKALNFFKDKLEWALRAHLDYA